MVYITPFFIRLSTPWLLDSFIWLAPGLFLLLLKPGFQRLNCSYLHYFQRKWILSTQVALTLAGLSTFLCAGILGEFYPGEDTSAVLGLAFIGFLIMDIGLTVLDETTTEMMQESVPSSDDIQQWTMGWKNFGRVTGFLLCSCDALNIGSRYIYYVTHTQQIGDSMTFTFSIAIFLFMALLVFILPAVEFMPEKPLYASGSASNSLCVLAFLESPLKLKLLFLGHFFSYGAYLLIAVYATSWVGISVLDGTPNAEKYTLRRRTFEIGVSWGAFAMLLNSLVSLLFSLILPHLRHSRYVSDGYLWGLAQAIAAVALLTTSRITEFKAIFVILPLCGFALATVSILANDLLKRLTEKYTVTCSLLPHPHNAAICPSAVRHSESDVLFSIIRQLKNLPDERAKLHFPEVLAEPWSEMMTLTSLLGQVAMFSVVPSVFLLWPGCDDNKWGMVTAGVSCVLGSLCAFLI